MADKIIWGSLYRDNDTGQLCKYFSPHPGQIDILNSEARFLVALGGVHSGKTSLGCLWLSREIEKTGGKGQYLIVGPTFPVVLSSTLESWLMTIRGTALAGTTGKFVASTANPHYKLATGGVVYFRSAESTFEGLKPQACLLDEGGDCSESAYHAIKRRTDGTGARVLISTTPYLRFDWIPREIIQRCDDGDPNYFYRCFPSSMNPTIDKAAIAEAKRTLPEWEYQLFYEGKYTRPPGMVYDFKTAEGESCFVDINTLPNNAAAYFGSIDYGGNDPTCCLVGMLDSDDVLWVFWEHYTQKQDIEELFTHLKEWNRSFLKKTGTKVKTWWCDHRPEFLMPLRRAGLNAKPANKMRGAMLDSIPLGISLVQARIRTGRLKIVSKTCPAIKAESLLYRYPMADGEAVGNKPIGGKNDHSMDALRYLIMGLDRKTCGRIEHEALTQRK